MASFVVPLPCGIPWLTGGVFSSEAARRRILPLSFFLDTASQKMVLAAADRAGRPKPQAELVPTQVVMQASCISVPPVASPAVDCQPENLEFPEEAQLTAARERAMADVAATLRALREEVAEQEAIRSRAVDEERREEEDYCDFENDDEDGESAAETEWEVVSESCVDAFAIHANC